MINNLESKEWGVFFMRATLYVETRTDKFGSIPKCPLVENETISPIIFSFRMYTNANQLIGAIQATILGYVKV